MTSEMNWAQNDRAESRSAPSISFWLNGFACPIGGQAIEADYENCAVLQERLRHSARPASLELDCRRAALISADESIGRIDGGRVIGAYEEDDDGDYAASSAADDDDDDQSEAASEDESPISVTAPGIGRQCENDCDWPTERQTITSSAPQPPSSIGRDSVEPNGGRKLCKEILVKFVIDESEPSRDGNEVFYLNPIVSGSF